MKFTVVPAQVTSVEDRIAGNLSVMQMSLLALPVFGGSFLYAILPPFMGGAIYKYVLLGVLVVASSTLAIRIKGKILLSWLIVILRYNRRPSLYVYNKRSLIGREIVRAPAKSTVKAVATKPAKKRKASLPSIGVAEAARMMKLIGGQDSDLRFEVNKKGGLCVRYTKIED
jgi:hypothetical protein